jgi:hypothetical protein
MPELTIDTSIKLDTRRIADLMVGAFEQNFMTNQWCTAARLRKPNMVELTIKHGGRIWYDIPELWGGDFEIDIYEFDEAVYDGGLDPNDPQGRLPPGITKHTITHENIAKGLVLMCTLHPRHWGNFIAENDDAITADVFLQLVTLGEVVYG